MRQTTKEALAEAFLDLLAKRNIDKITVKDIVAECGVNRQTFYYHFHDIYDLMEWSLARKIEAYIGNSLDLSQNWQKQIKGLFHFFYLHRVMILHGYDATNRMQYERAMIKWASPLVRKQLDAYPQARAVPENKKEFITKVYARSFSALLLEWVEDGMPDESYLQLEDYFLIVDGSMGNALEKFMG